MTPKQPGEDLMNAAFREAAQGRKRWFSFSILTITLKARLVIAWHIVRHGNIEVLTDHQRGPGYVKCACGQMFPLEKTRFLK